MYESSDITGKIKREDSITAAIAAGRITGDEIVDAEIAAYIAKPPMSEDELRKFIAIDTVSFTTLDTNLSRLDNTATIEAWRPEPQPPRRLRCEYCGCLAEKDYGNCDHCGAPL